MAVKYVIDDETMTQIAGPLRSLAGRTDELTPAEMAAAGNAATSEVNTQTDLIAQISAALEGKATPSAGKPEQEKTLNVTENDDYEVTPDDGYTLSKVTVSVNVPTGGGGNTDIEDGFINRTISGAYSNNRVTVVGQYAFGNCDLLTEADFPLVTDVANYAFRGCAKLASINFPLVKTVGNYGFYQCNVTRVDFPALTRLGAYGLGGCANLEALIIRSQTLASMTANTGLQGTKIASGTGYIYVPRALLSDTDKNKDYRRATNWSAHAAQFRAIEDYPEITGG